MPAYALDARTQRGLGKQRAAVECARAYRLYAVGNGEAFKRGAIEERLVAYRLYTIADGEGRELFASAERRLPYFRNALPDSDGGYFVALEECARTYSLYRGGDIHFCKFIAFAKGACTYLFKPAAYFYCRELAAVLKGPFAQHRQAVWQFYRPRKPSAALECVCAYLFKPFGKGDGREVVAV